MVLNYLTKVRDNKIGDGDIDSNSDLFDIPSFPWEHYLAYFSYLAVKTASSS